MSDTYNSAYAYQKDKEKRNVSKEDVLYNPEFRNAQESFAKSSIEAYEPSLKYNTERFKNADKELSEFERMTKQINWCSEDMERLKDIDPKAYKEAVSEFEKIINNKIPEKEAKRIQKGKKAKVNLSNKSLLGKLKKNIRKLWRGSIQDVVEDRLSTLKMMMVKNPKFKNYVDGFLDVSSLKDISYKEFTDNVSTREKYIKKERSDALSRVSDIEYSNGINQARIDYIEEVKDNAAKEIETKMHARENIGIKDAQANTGVDKLAERAKAMEGMSSEQRMAYRLEQLRGTKKPESKPVKQTTLDPKVAARAVSGNQK